MSGTCIAKASCPACNSSDAVQIFEQADGRRDAFCFACDTSYKSHQVEGLTVTEMNTTAPNHSHVSLEDIYNLPLQGIPDRGLSEETLEHFGVRVVSDPEGKIITHYYPHVNSNRELVGYKKRNVKDKTFSKVGNTKNSILFGQNVCPSNRKLFITEGELDCMALYQMFKERAGEAKKHLHPSVVSVSNGASSIKQVVDQMDFLKRFAEIIIVFDSDEAGQKGAEKLAQALELPVKIARLEKKDVCDMIAEGLSNELFFAVMKEAQPYQPDGVVNAADSFDRYKNRKSAECFNYPDAFATLNEKTYGWRFGSLVTITSGSGMGKTQLKREIQYDVLKNTEFKIADISLEEDVGDTIEGLMALELEKRIHLPDVEISEEEERAAFDKLFSDERVEMYDHFGGCSDEELISRINYMSKVLGCRVFFLDHLSIVISDGANEGDERRRIDNLMTKLAKTVKALDIVIFMIVHLKKAPQGKSFEEGYVPTSDDLRGSASIKQLSWDVIAVSRNQQDTDPIRKNTSQLHVLKCRFSGDTGGAGHLFYDQNTGRMLASGDPYATEDEFDNVEESEVKF